MKFYKLNILIFSSLLLILIGCDNSEKSPGYDYFPDMAYSRAYEAYGYNSVFEDSLQALYPVKGTVPRGFQPFHYPFTNEGYEAAGNELTNPLQPTMENINEGKYYYDIYCNVCHGPGGEGNGSIVLREKFPPPPSYLIEPLLSLPDGKMYYSIYHGKGLMGSYASQLNAEERWKVILYINSMQAKASPTEDNATNNETTADTTTTAAVQ